MRAILAAALALPLAVPALAQSGTGAAPIRQPGPPQITTPGEVTSSTVKPGGLDNGGPGSAGTLMRGGTGATSTDNNPGAAGNAGKPEMPIGNTGGGGESGSGG
jgi:hypothetical protein